MTKKIALALSIAAVLIGALGTGAYLYMKTNEETQKPNAPVFTVDESQTMGWWSSPNTNAQASTNEDEYQYGPFEELPIATIMVHHNSPDGERHADSCFVSFSYYDYLQASAAEAYDKFEARLTEFGSSYEPLGSTPQTISTPWGEKSYELRSYHTKATSAGEYLSGLQMGYVALDGGHITVQTVCKTPEDSALTLPIIPAVRLGEITNVRLHES